MQQQGAGLTSAEHELDVPQDGGRHRLQVVPLQQAVTLETKRAGHDWRGRAGREKENAYKLTKVLGKAAGGEELTDKNEKSFLGGA